MQTNLQWQETAWWSSLTEGHEQTFGNGDYVHCGCGDGFRERDVGHNLANWALEMHALYLIIRYTSTQL